MIRTIVKTSSKIKKELTFFLITDLHYSNKSDLKKYQAILKSLKKTTPDFVLLGGDLLDSANAQDTDVFLKMIESWAFICPIFVVLGNHDFTNMKPLKYKWNDAFFTKLRQIKNVKILDNQVYEKEQFRMIGITLPYSYYYIHKEKSNTLKEVLQNKFPDSLSSNKLNLLLIHSPLGFKEEVMEIPFLKTIDFICAGHTHNGCVPRIAEPIFKNRGLISPSKKLFPTLVRGVFSLKQTTFIVSGGFTKLSKKSRLSALDRFWNHEITKITIKPNF